MGDGPVQKEEIRDYDLICYFIAAIDDGRSQIFEYILEWDPAALEDETRKGECLLLQVTWQSQNGEIEMALKAGLHYYPDHLDFLYEQDDDHHNAWGDGEARN